MAARRVLFISTGSAVRAQMAAGFLRHLGGAGVVARSAAPDAAPPPPLAVRVMAEVGVELPAERTLSPGDYVGQSFDVAVTLCDAGPDT
ncbi:MAG TPA: hypothetical protein VFW96_29360 [Thermomicrobiales bacterium]|nr:hypothetical protein [Thermomicrobiales bacterium]